MFNGKRLDDEDASPLPQFGRDDSQMRRQLAALETPAEVQGQVAFGDGTAELERVPPHVIVFYGEWGDVGKNWRDQNGLKLFNESLLLNASVA